MFFIFVVLYLTYIEYRYWFRFTGSTECIGFLERKTCLFCQTEDLLHSKTITGLATLGRFVYFFIFQLYIGRPS